MRDVDIRDYIGYSEELTAEQVRKLEPGAKVIRHSFDRWSAHQTMEMTVVQSGKKKMLSARDWYRGHDHAPADQERDGADVLHERRRMMEQTNMERNDLANAPVKPDPEEEIRALRMHIKELEHHIEFLNDRNTIAGLEGEIHGLKFSIMCNGVSGGEINAARR